MYDNRIISSVFGASCDCPGSVIETSKGWRLSIWFVLFLRFRVRQREEHDPKKTIFAFQLSLMGYDLHLDPY